MRVVTSLAAGMLVASLASPVLAAERARTADWPTFLIASPSAITVPPPPSAAATAAELVALRGKIAARPADLALRLRRTETGGPVHRWNEAAIGVLVDRHITVGGASRALALLHASLHDVSAVVWTAKATYKRQAPSEQDPALAVAGVRSAAPSYPSEAAAVAAAASTILAALIPAEAERFRALAAEEVALRQHAALEFPSDAEAGRKIGEAVAALALARAREDGAARPWTGTMPTGPGRWQGTNPAAPLAGTWRTWVLPSGDAVRPAAPPAHDSPETAAALAELKAYPRTPKTNSDSVFWEAYGGARIFQFWNEQLGRLALEYRLGEDRPRLAATYAALTTAFYDSFVACWDAKYAYWHIRPAQLDPTLTTVVPAPAHPSYPSAHSCMSSASGTLLAALFPLDAAAMLEFARQAGEARVAAGIHYRYDVTAADEIGRRTAAAALAKLKPALQ